MHVCAIYLAKGETCTYVWRKERQWVCVCLNLAKGETVCMCMCAPYIGERRDSVHEHVRHIFDERRQCACARHVSELAP